MDTKELDAIHAAMIILQAKGHEDAAGALGAILIQEAPTGWWSS